MFPHFVQQLLHLLESTFQVPYIASGTVNINAFSTRGTKPTLQGHCVSGHDASGGHLINGEQRSYLGRLQVGAFQTIGGASEAPTSRNLVSTT